MHTAGRSNRRTVAALAAISCLALVAWVFLPYLIATEPVLDVVMATVQTGPFVYRVNELGEIESSSNVEVRCEVRSGNSDGTNILQIAPEGTHVNAGDLLVKLDDSALQTELIQQQIVATNSQSDMIEAQATLDAARIALTEYELGTFRAEEELLESQLFIAQENERRAEEFLRYSRRLAYRGYVSEGQLQADQFAVEKARKEHDVAATQLYVLSKFTKQKMLTMLRAQVDTAEARLKSKQKTWELDKRLMQEIEDQIAKCSIPAPVAGQVVYANDPERRGADGDILIAEGRPVRERQVMIRLPDPNKMRVVAKIHESRIGHIKPGMDARIVLDSSPDRPLSGTVDKINEYPLPSVSIYTTHIKEYETEIEIDSPPSGLRPGMSAEVSILVKQVDQAIQVPVQAVVGRNGRHFCVLQGPQGSFESREVKVGVANEKFLIILSGLQAGEQVVTAPLQYESLFELPDVSPAGKRPRQIADRDQREQLEGEGTRTAGNSVSGSGGNQR